MARGKSIDDYQKKRDFGATPEPPPGEAAERGEARIFVVHRHDASRLHYDLRLEVDGVLRSWAVPKGFSFDPTEKHLALRTEDHPIEYEHFSGVIPKGQYGAGTMTIWDRGRYELVVEPDWDKALAKGEVKVLFYGRRLRGEWHMVKTKQGEDTWLLFKSRDRYAGPARDAAVGVDLFSAEEGPMPERVEPMMSKASVAPFSDPAWLFEMEFTGRRVFAEKKGGSVGFRGLEAELEELEEELSSLGAENALLDGVLVVLDESERPSKELLEARLAGKNDAQVWYYAFDLLYFDEFDLRGLSLLDRKTALRSVLPEPRSVLYLDHVAGDGERLAEVVQSVGLPSIIAKRSAAPYAGGASEDWRRVEVDLDASATELDVSSALAKTTGKPRKSKVKFTNLDKIFWPAESFTKGDLVGWYESIAEFLLPYLRDRPLHLNRFPDGIEGKSFYQRHKNETIADWIETVWIDSESKGEPQEHMLCQNRDSLLYFANSGSIDLHPWLSRVETWDSPDWAVIDLDPKEAPFKNVVKIARVTGRILREIGLRAAVKTSGASGLHIYVPLVPGYTYEHSRMFCEGVARVVCRELPDIATVERVVGSREGKVYVDYGQNRKSQTVVPPHVPRPVPGATVSTPLHWDELDSKLHPSLFTIQTARQRLEEFGDLFRLTLEDPQDLLPAISLLQEQLGN